jgi:hypothetical protein
MGTVSGLRSALVAVLRELPPAEISRIVRAAPDEALRALVPIALGLEEGVEDAPPQRARKPRAATAKTAEAARGTRPTSTIERLLEALSDGPLTTGTLAEALEITKSGVVAACKRAGPKVVHPVGKLQRGVETTWEATGK